MEDKVHVLARFLSRKEKKVELVGGRYCAIKYGL